MDNEVVEIVLVDDNLNDVELMIRALKKINLANKIVHLKDGVEGADFLLCKGKYSTRNINNKPKVVLLDLKMPRMDGLEVLEKIKKDERTNTIPIVILTSSKEDPDIRKAYELGASSYIVKPVDFDNFSKAVAELGFYWLLLNEAPKYNIDNTIL
ncbi:MAG TPA: response regulator [Bacteroidia bacterium]|jgi:CheY-like chemotaxis protein|nr:response regulator [Bacteroidia bacterium]